MRAAWGPAILLGVLALLAAAPLVGADHVFSHRVLVVGRVLDSDGLPAPGLPVNVTFAGVTPVGSCYDTKDERTGPQGDYTVCRHVHQLPPGASVRIAVGGASREVPIDPDLRHASASFRLDAPRAVRDVEGDILFARTLLVTGRAFSLLREPLDSEGVIVNATPIGGNITVELRANDSAVASRNVTATEDGLYRAELAVSDIPPGATVRVRATNALTEVAVDQTFRRADANLVRDLRLLAGPGEDAPGGGIPLAPWAAVAAIAVAAIASGARRRCR